MYSNGALVSSGNFADREYPVAFVSVVRHHFYSEFLCNISYFDFVLVSIFVTFILFLQFSTTYKTLSNFIN